MLPPSPAPSSVRIRTAREADIPTITWIYGHHVLTGTASFELEAPGEDEMRIRYQGVLDRKLPYLVAIDDAGSVLGYAYAGPYRPRPAYRYTVENSVYIHPDHRGRRIGTQLLAALIEACSGGDLREMIAVIGDSANVASIRLHEQAGFRHAGIFTGVGQKFGRWLDTVLMQRPLGPRP